MKIKVVNFSMLFSHTNSTAKNVERGGTLIVKNKQDRTQFFCTL